MFSPFFRAVGQLDDPTLLGVLLRSFLISALCFAGLGWGCIAALQHWVPAHGAMAVMVGVLGGLLAIAGALWLFLPLAVLIASCFINPVCAAVERRWYPGLPPPVSASLAAQTWTALVISFQVLMLSLVALLLVLVLPGPGHLLGWAVTAWALGRGLFAAVAMRRMSAAQARDCYLRNRGIILLQGAALALAGAVPPLNLLLPVVGPAAMVHVLLRPGARPESWG